MVWYSHLLKNIPVFCDLHRDFGITSEAEVDVFLDFSCFFFDLTDVRSNILQ